MKLQIVLLVSLLHLCHGQVINGTNNYVTFFTGDINILITVPHDGALRPESIKTRSNSSSCSLNRGVRTAVIAEVVRNDLASKFGANPFMLINNLHREKMDPNCPPNQYCAKTTEASYVAYTNYHNFTKQYIQFIKNGQRVGRSLIAVLFKQALILDIQGQEHDHNLNELGYGLTKSQLNSGSFVREDSTICSLAKANRLNSFTSIIRGSVSLGKYLSNRTAPIGSVPSPSNPTLASNQDYNSGGYTIQTYGSKNCAGNINAIQIALSSKFRADDSGLTDRARKLSNAILEFYLAHNMYDKSAKLYLWQ